MQQSVIREDVRRYKHTRISFHFIQAMGRSGPSALLSTGFSRECFSRHGIPAKNMPGRRVLEKAVVIWVCSPVTAGLHKRNRGLTPIIPCNPVSFSGTWYLVTSTATLSIALQTHTDPADDAVLRFSLKSVKVFNHRNTDRQ